MLLPLYLFAFAMWRWEKKDMVDSRFTGRDGEAAGGQATNELIRDSRDSLPGGNTPSAASNVLTSTA